MLKSYQNLMTHCHQHSTPTISLSRMTAQKSILRLFSTASDFQHLLSHIVCLRLLFRGFYLLFIDPFISVSFLAFLSFQQFIFLLI